MSYYTASERHEDQLKMTVFFSGELPLLNASLYRVGWGLITCLLSIAFQ